jgi:aromatic ring-opening dioxygenase catalytic subunit (LigB family)
MTVPEKSDPANWRKKLDLLPTGGRIPAFFFAHGCRAVLGNSLTIAPMLIWPENVPSGRPLDAIGGPNGSNAQFLREFGRGILEKYNPQAIVVFSAHWETHNHIEGRFPLFKLILTFQL